MSIVLFIVGIPCGVLLYNLYTKILRMLKEGLYVKILRTLVIGFYYGLGLWLLLPAVICILTLKGGFIGGIGFGYLLCVIIYGWP